MKRTIDNRYKDKQPNLNKAFSDGVLRADGIRITRNQPRFKQEETRDFTWFGRSAWHEEMQMLNMAVELVNRGFKIRKREGKVSERLEKFVERCKKRAEL